MSKNNIPMAVCVNIQEERYVYYITRTSYILYHVTHIFIHRHTHTNKQT